MRMIDVLTGLGPVLIVFIIGGGLIFMNAVRCRAGV
jgi:hypothetical protein